LPVPRLVGLAKADGQPAIAVTDTNNLYGALEFSEKAAAAGVQPIIGIQLSVDFGGREGNGRHNHRTICPSLVLLAKDETGYRNLMALSSKSFLDIGPTEDPHVRAADLEPHAEGLIALTGGSGGPVNLALAARREDEARLRLERLLALFGDRLYAELQRHGEGAEAAAEPALVALAYELGIPLVATNEAYFPAREDFEAHDALLCIAQGKVVADPDRRQLTPEHFLKSRAEMAALFTDLPEAIASTVEIAERCAYRPLKRKPILPGFTGVTGEAAEAAEAAELRRQAGAGLRMRLDSAGRAPGLDEEAYAKRLDYELGVIERMKFPGYFLIVADFIKWAKAQGIPVGPGRGSGAGSLVAYSLTITDLDPLRFDLLFERFLNPDRVSMPDFDVDFCQDRRDEVIRYVRGKYGHEQVAQIITFGTLQARAVLRDVGRVLQMPYGQVDRLAKLVPFVPTNPVTLAKAIEDDPKLQAERDRDPLVRRLFEIALKLEGLYRHPSVHAAGVVIGDRPLRELVPLFREPGAEMPATQFNMKWVESAGLVKFDFLGLKTLTMLEHAVTLVRARGLELDLARIPLDDTATYALLARGETVGVFQLEGAGMRRALIEMRPDRFEDIIALVALYRPGPMANIPTYNNRKHGQEQPDYIHPKLEPILRETYGVIIYQEQVMQIAQVLSGYSLGEADLLRRAMGKKIKAEMAAQRERFVEGAVERGLAKAKADQIFDLLAKFADYGFNKSHAAAYALVAYQTAYLKANFPTEFLAASMTLDMGRTDKLSDFRREAARLGVRIERPSINRGGADFEVQEGAIRYSLCALKGVGRQAVDHLVEARRAGPFKDLADFARRINPRIVNKRMLECLVAAGAFDDVEKNRARISAGLDLILAESQRAHDGAQQGQSELFGGSSAPGLRLPEAEPWSPGERLTREYGVVGFFLSGHPLDDFMPVLPSLGVQCWAAFADGVREGRTAGKLAAVVIDRQERKTKAGGRMTILCLSDPTGQYEAIVFSDTLAQLDPVLRVNAVLQLYVHAEEQPDGIRVRIQDAKPLEAVLGRVRRGLRLVLEDPTPLERIARSLAQGEGDVRIVARTREGREVTIRLPGSYQVTPQLAGALTELPGVLRVEQVLAEDRRSLH
ncbi:MAG: DNA polymerase III subunit alpha, partial [Pseudomonadota bacterium]|nr:DNA polymerase III subunit alpha [Pseudomonadota bacterium]